MLDARECTLLRMGQAHAARPNTEQACGCGGGAAPRASRPGASVDAKKDGAPGPNTDKSRSARKEKQDRLKTQKAELTALKKSQANNRDSKPPKTQPPAKVAKGHKGSGKGGKGPSLPAAFVGGNALTTDGKRKCYGFNTGERQTPECKATLAGGTCPNGLHACTHSKCKDLSHSLLQCRNK